MVLSGCSWLNRLLLVNLYFEFLPRLMSLFKTGLVENPQFPLVSHHSCLDLLYLRPPSVNSWALHPGRLTLGPQLIAHSRSLAPDPPQSKHAPPRAARRVLRRAPIQSLQNVIMYICRFRATCKHAPRASDIPPLQKWSQKSMIGPVSAENLGCQVLGLGHRT